MVNKKIIFLIFCIGFFWCGCSIDDEPAEDNLELEKLKAMPYLSHTTEKVNRKQSGVTFYNPDLAYDGYNIYNSTLMDMEGNILRKWKGTLLTFLEDGDLIARYQQKLQRYDQSMHAKI